MTPQRKALTLVVFWCVVACAAWVGPWSYGGEANAGTAETSPSTAATPTPTSSEESPSPEPSPTVTPSPTPTVTPSPSGPERSGSDPEKRSAPLAVASLTASIQASPAAIEVGESTTVTATLANQGDSAAENSALTISVPNSLELTSVSPEPDQIENDPGGTSINYEFGNLEAGGQRTVTLVAEGVRDPGSPVTVEAAGRADGLTTFGQTQVEITEPPASTARISDVSGPTFAQVGDDVRYRLTLSNPGQTPAEDIAVVYLVPDELHVLGANFPPGADAVQIGVFKGKEDIVWAVDKLAPGKKLTLEWNGTVEKAGDLAARSSARLEADGTVTDRGEGSTYLAKEAGTGADNPEFEPIVRKVMVSETVTVDTPSERVPTETDGTAASGSELPFTGGTPGRIFLIAVGAILVGAAFVFLTSKRLRGRRVIVGCVALLVLASACMGSEEPTLPDRVKGETITRGDGQGENNGDQADESDPQDEDGSLDDPAVDPNEDAGDGQGDEPGADPDGDGEEGGDGDLADLGPDPIGDPDDDEVAAPAPTDPEPTEPETRVVRRVTTRTIEEDDLTIEATPSMTGSSFGVSTAGGSRSSATRAGAALLTSHVRAVGDHLEAVVTVTNTSERKRIQLDGVLRFEVAGFGQLRSNGIDRVLNPGGEARASYEFKLPSGGFDAQPSYVS